MPGRRPGLRTAVAWAGLAVAAPFFAWALLGLLPPVPSIVDVFGVDGVRTPAAITIFGLLLAAIGFHEP
ncbi:MAG: hypothetical protein R3323_06385 [Wenzhouxiangellaceae bacterium]|nr:hypothetical protein [Wenzhouxiangellaceae bacterium]